MIKALAIAMSAKSPSQMRHQDEFRDASPAMLAGIEKIAAEIAARAAEIEDARSVPRDLVNKLKSIGLFRLFVPRSHGGLELALPAGLEIITALSRLDGSVGWTVMIGCGSAIFAGLLRRETYEQIYQSGPDVILGGSAQPAGTAERTTGGWRVNGQWPFASGSPHADWLFGLCTVTENGKPLVGSAGQPQVRGFLLPAGDWDIKDTWHAMGLKGTGSHHIALKDAVVPEANIINVETGVPCVPGPLYPAVRQVLPLCHSAFCVGVAEGALDELVALANTGRQQLRAATPMRESEAFQLELGRVAADLRAAQAYHRFLVAGHWQHALAGTLKDAALLTQGIQAAVWIATTCVRVADACFALAGASAVYETSPLQRRLRDLHVAAQHATAQQRLYVDAGKLLLSRSAEDGGRTRP
jgi:alkylation response protein AidB-like acyl-CoA dehydrogenase